MAPKLGIVAGGGSLPGHLIEACRRSGRDFMVLALEGHADPGVIGDAPQAWVRLGASATGIAMLKEAGVAELIMAGPVRRPSLKDLRPDWHTARFFARLGMTGLGDDGLLRAVIRVLEDEGFRVVGIESVLGGLLARSGVHGAVRPDEQALADVERGLAVAKGLGALDVGQSVVVQQGIVLGVEAAEGTEGLIRRCGPLRREGPGGVLVKIAKPGQERRADLPTIGPDTVSQAAAAALRGIAVEAGATLVIDAEATVRAADAAGLFLVGIAVAP